ncbi:MAG TPA: rRNA maturation RNase YbeY [Treponema sp.]|nr:rRNA maturation RNase YbeY [Treponema sp.]
MANKISVEPHESTEKQSWMDNVASFVDLILRYLEIDQWELSILFCGDSYISELNKKYRSVEGPTDVLSFEQGDEYIDENDETWFTAGDILISVDTLMNNAQIFEVTINEELKRLLIHGVLHLNDMDHATNDPDEQMLQLQERILGNFPSIILIKE